MKSGAGCFTIVAEKFCLVLALINSEIGICCFAICREQLLTCHQIETKEVLFLLIITGIRQIIFCQLWNLRK